MAKSQLFRPPILDFIINHGGTFPVRRGHRDEEAFITAHSIFDRGGTVLMYAEGGRQRTKELGQPKPGLGRLALESGVPVVPIAIHGSEHAREARRGTMPKVTVQFGAPLRYEQVDHPSRERSQEVAEQVFDRVRLMYEALTKNGRARRPRKPAPRARRGRARSRASRLAFLRTCQLTVISRDRLAVLVGQVDRHRELDLSVGLERGQQLVLRGSRACPSR